MIHTESFEINGRSFIRTWSDTGYVRRDGVVYVEANDPADLGRTYEEVDGPEVEVVDDVDTEDEAAKTASQKLTEQIRIAARFASV